MMPLYKLNGKNTTLLCREHNTCNMGMTGQSASLNLSQVDALIINRPLSRNSRISLAAEFTYRSHAIFSVHKDKIFSSM